MDDNLLLLTSKMRNVQTEYGKLKKTETGKWCLQRIKFPFVVFQNRKKLNSNA